MNRIKKYDDVIFRLLSVWTIDEISQKSGVSKSTLRGLIMSEKATERTWQKLAPLIREIETGEREELNARMKAVQLQFPDCVSTAKRSEPDES